ncbi:hypothetical protein BDZ97DRAFT_1917751 [Flammula alnicola]|nr:hypothetical protein BDZ97DRAFT_1917751 [Flammula alnicola]
MSRGEYAHPQAVPVHQTAQPLSSSTPPVSPPDPTPPALTPPPWHPLSLVPSADMCTFSAYSASAYDCSPIVVTPNSCAFPERGCASDTYLFDEGGSPSPTQPAGHHLCAQLPPPWPLPRRPIPAAPWPQPRRTSPSHSSYPTSPQSRTKATGSRVSSLRRRPRIVTDTLTPRYKAYITCCHPPASASHFPPIVEETDDAQPAHKPRRRTER